MIDVEIYIALHGLKSTLHYMAHIKSIKKFSGNLRFLCKLPMLFL